MKKQKLNLDLDTIFPGSPLTIGNETVIIRPLNIEQLSHISKKVSGLGAILAEKNITMENFNVPEKLFQLAVIALDNVPDVLEEASNIELESLRQLPIEIIVQIIAKIVDENMKSKESLEKNFKSLTKQFLVQKDVVKIPTTK